ncbi:MAG: sigma-70 family RNA polymerase sigma factor [Armatimonadetes bacterium]|nr:sigma-70 family RNA polymerase sigma factor [Armatimonadota bacterium]
MRRLDGAYNLAHSYMGNPQDAEDAVQEAVLKAYKSFGSFRGEDSRAWFFKIVKNTCLRHLEKRKRMPEPMATEDLDQHESEQTNRPDNAALRAASHEMVREELGRLPMEYREILVLREFEEMNYHEIGTVLEVPIGTVMSRLSRARAQLIAQLKQRLEAST